MSTEKRVASVVTKREVRRETIYTVSPVACPKLYSQETISYACCIYSAEHNYYVCPYSGEEVRVNGLGDTGPASSYCTYK